MKQFLFIITAIITFYAAAIAQPDTLWTALLSTRFDERANDILICDNGNLVSIGEVTINSIYTPELIKLTQDGTILEVIRYPDVAPAIGYEVALTQDGGFFISGRSDMFGIQVPYLIRTDSIGNVTWQRVYEELQLHVYENMNTTNDGGVVITGFLGWMTGFDIFLVKVDGNGNILWQQSYDYGNNDFGRTVVQCDDGGYLIAGSSSSFEPGKRAFILKTDELGTQEWYICYTSSVQVDLYDLVKSGDGGYIAAGRYEYTVNDDDFYIMKIDSIGNRLYENIIGGSDIDECFALMKCQSGGFLMGGVTYSYGADSGDLLLIKVDDFTNEEWHYVLGWEFCDFVNGIVENNLGEVFCAGASLSNIVSYDCLFMGFAYPVQDVTSFNQELPKDNIVLNCNPNPFNQRLALEYVLPEAADMHLAVYDILGREIQLLANGHSSLGKHTIVWDASEQSSGVYFIRLMVDGRWSMVEKVVLVK